MNETTDQLVSHNLLQGIIESIPIRIFWKDTQGRFLGCNTLFAWDAGLSHPSELIGKTDLDMPWHEQAELYQADDRRVIESGNASLAYEEPQTTPEGNNIWLRTSKVPLRNEQGNIVGILGIYEDITAEKEKQSALQNSRSELNNIFNSLQEAYYRTDIEGRLVRVSPSAGVLMACDPDELIGKDIGQYYFRADGREQFLKALHENDGRVFNYEAEIRRVDNEVIWVSTNAHYFRDADGNVTGVEGTIRDVTKLKQQEEQLLLAKFVLDHAPLNITYLDSEAHIRYINKTGCDTLGYTQEELLRLSIPDIDPLFPIDAWNEHWEKLKQNRSLQVETEHRRKNGERFPVEVRANYIEFGDKAYNVAFDMDISERKRIEKQLQLTQFSLDHAPDAVFWMRPNGSFVYVNDEACRRLGYSRDELLNMGVSDIDPGLPDGVPAEMAEKTRQHGVARVESVHRTKAGEMIPVDILVSYIGYEGEEYHCAFVRDISERKKIEDELRNEVRFRRQLLDQASEGIALWHPESEAGTARFLTWNRRMQEITGYSCEEINRLGWLETIYNDDAERNKALETMQSVLNGEINHGKDFTIVTKHGEERIVNISSAAVEREGQPCVLAVVKDITQNKRQGALLDAERERFRTLFEASSDGIFILDMKGRFVDINRTAHERLGYSKDEMIALGIKGIDTPEYAARVPERIAMIMEHGSATFETAHCRKDGSVMPVEISSRIIELNGEKVFFSVVRDISDRKALEEQLRHSQKMEAVGTLVGGIAHDFNNMLAAIQGNVYLARMQLKEQPHAVEKLRSIEQLGNRAAEMVQQLLTFARKDRVAKRTFNLNSFMNEGVKLTKTLIPENIDHKTTICSEPLTIDGDATQLQQVIMNLLNNAVDAVAETANPMIRCSLTCFKADDAFLRKHPTLQGEQFARISVVDNGHGIPRDQLSNIFEPFFTTKEVGKGTGLGLAMLYGAVHSHDGIVEVESKVNRGTEFHIYLPLSGKQTESVVEHEPEVSNGKHQTILIVDDDSDVRQTTCDVLASMGYRILEADNGKSAMDLFGDPEHGIDLVISDVIMPKIGGVDLLRAVRKQRPQLPFILVTGYDKEQVLQEEAQTERCRVVNKPYDFNMLSKSIQELLGRED